MESLRSIVQNALCRSTVQFTLIVVSMTCTLVFRPGIVTGDCSGEVSTNVQSESWHTVWERKGATSEDVLHELNGFSQINLSEWQSLVCALSGKVAPLVKNSTRLLDVGCGAGAFLDALRNCSEVNLNETLITGVDFSSSLVERAKTRFPDSTFVTADMRNLSFLRDSSFDVVTSFSTLFYLSSDDSVAQALQELMRVATPTGVILLADVSDANKKKLAQNLRKKSFYYTSQQQKIVTKTLDHHYVKKTFVRRIAAEQGFMSTFMDEDVLGLHFYEPSQYRFTAVLHGTGYSGRLDPPENSTVSFGRTVHPLLPFELCDEQPSDPVDSFYSPQPSSRGETALRRARKHFQSSCPAIEFSTVDHGILSMDCPEIPNGANPMYGYDRNNISFPYTGPVDLEGRNWVFAECSFTLLGRRRNVHYIARPLRLKPQSGQSSSLYNVFMIQLDALGRPYAPREFPQLVSLLRSNAFASAKVVEFEHHSVVGYNSRPNMQAIYCSGKCEDPARNIFAAFNSSGFKSLFTENWCPQYPSFNLPLYVDKVFHENFHCMYGGSAWDMHSAEGCIDGGWAQERLGKYLHTMIVESTAGVQTGMFSVSNFLEAHTTYAFRAQPLDAALSAMMLDLERVNVLENSIFIFFGDHGLHDEFDNFAEIANHRNPFLAFVVGKNAGPRAEEWVDNLKLNSKSLTDQTDLHATAIALADALGTHTDGINLLVDKVPRHRRCVDTNIPNEWCPCFVS